MNGAMRICFHGHPMDEVNIYINPKGWRSCRVCRRRSRLEYAEKHPVGQGQSQARWQGYFLRMKDTPEYKARRAASAYRWRNNPANRIKTRAHNKVKYALKRKKIEREPCIICDRPNAEAHHEDYSRPLDIVWLCREHHRGLHVQRKAA